MSGYKVITDALRKEAPKWDEFTRALVPPKHAVEDASLGVLAFFCGNPVVLMLDINAALHQSAYEGYRHFMVSVLDGALRELPQIADTLVKIAGKYDAAEDIVELDLDQVWDAKAN
jgi:hypothetical protein